MNMELLKIIKSTAAHMIQPDPTAIRLKELDNIAAIEASCQRLNLDLKQELFSNDDYLNYFIAIDEKTRLLTEKVTDSYLKINISNQPHKTRMANAVFLHHKLMFSIYFKLIVALTPSKHRQLASLIGRAMNNATEIIKWRYYNYQGAPGNVWLQVSQLYDIAERYELTQEKIAIYDDLQLSEFIPDTISSSFITTNMLGSVETLSFKPPQYQLLSQLLSKWSDGIAIDQKFDDKRHLFNIDLEQNLPAKRIRNLKERISNRYWCMDSINIKIQVLMNCIETGRTPKQPAMKILINDIYAMQTLSMIRTEWSLSEYKRQRRANPRVKTNKVASNVVGFEDTYYQIKQYEDSLVEVTKKAFSDNKNNASKTAEDLRTYTESMTTFLDKKHGFCNIVDESINGLCLHVEKKANEIAIGMMIGIAVKDNRFAIKIGVIRSIKTTDNNTLRVGVEIISRNAFSVSGYLDEKLNAQMPKAANDSAPHQVITELIEEHFAKEAKQTENFNSLFLPKEFSFNQDESLILPKHKYVHGGMYRMMIAKSEKLIKVDETLEQNDNWMRVGFTEINIEVSQESD